MSEEWPVYKRLNRKIFLLVMLLMSIIVAFRPLGFPVPPMETVQDFINTIENTPDGSVVFLGFYHDVISFYVNSRDFYGAIMQHLATHNMKMIMLSYGRESAGAFEDMVIRYGLEEKYGYKYGVDYVIFPFLAGEESAIAAAADLKTAYTTDNRGDPIDTLPLLQTVSGIQDAELCLFQSHIITIPHMFVRQWCIKYGIKGLSMGGYAQVAQYYGTYVFGSSDRAALYELDVGFPGEEVSKLDMVNLEGLLMAALILIGLVHSFLVSEKKAAVETGGVKK